jgi:hypothetical protein
VDEVTPLSGIAVPLFRAAGEGVWCRGMLCSARIFFEIVDGGTDSNPSQNIPSFAYLEGKAFRHGGDLRCAAMRCL